MERGLESQPEEKKEYEKKWLKKVGNEIISGDHADDIINCMNSIMSIITLKKLLISSNSGHVQIVLTFSQQRSHQNL